MTAKPKSHAFKLWMPSHVRRAVLLLSDLDLSIPWEFSLKPYKRNRSLEQQALYRKWVRIIAEDLGWNEDDLHTEFKAKYVTLIVERDDPHYRTALETCRGLFHEGEVERATKLADYVKSRVSTTWLNVSQFSELMRNVETFAGEYGISLPQPEPLPPEHKDDQ